MNKVLVVHLKRFGDLVAAGQTISSMRAQHPHQEISLLCFEEFSAVAKLIPGLKNIYTLSRNTLLTLKNGRLYSDGFAVDELQRRLAVVSEQRWDKVINLTNDRSSAYLCSWLGSFDKGTAISGLYYDQHGMTQASNLWSSIFNNILPESQRNSPFNFRDVWAQMCDIQDAPKGALLTNKRNDENVTKNFATLRAKDGKIIGIQVYCSIPDKGFSSEVAAQIISGLKQEKHHPLLLIAPHEVERQRVQEIIAKLDFKPVIVECDFTALSSVVKHCDLIITPDTVTKHIADAHQVSCIEVSLGSSPTFKQATMNTNSRLLVVRDPKQGQIPASDILSAMATFNGGEPELSNNSILYAPTKVAGFTIYNSVAGTPSLDQELDRHACTDLLLKITKGEDYDKKQTIAAKAYESTKHIQGFNAWAVKNKDLNMQAMKDVLHTIRSLLQLKTNPRQTREFVFALEKLFSYSEGPLNVTTVAMQLFRAQLEELPNASFQENSRIIEGLLFELKTNLQLASSLISDWEKIWNASKLNVRASARFEAQL